MARTRNSILLAVALILGLAAAAGPAHAASDAILKSSLSGGNLVPGPGDPDGSGEARVYIDGDTNWLCASLTVRNIAPATGAHIHFGAAGQNGGHAVDLAAPINGSSFYCTSVSASILDAMTTAPQNFYVNVHNDEYPAGALRGQLAFS